MPIYVLFLQKYKIPKIFNIKFPLFSIQNSQDFQFIGGIWYENVASIVTHNRVETYLNHMENP